MPQLLVLQGKNVKSTHNITKRITLGNQSDCDILLDSNKFIEPSVYFEISQQGKKYELRNFRQDIQAQVNGTKGDLLELAHGDLITIVDLILLFLDTHDKIAPIPGDQKYQTLEDLITKIQPEEKEQQQLLVLYKISHILFYTFDLQEACKQLTLYLMEVFQATKCCILLKDLHVDQVHPIVAYHNDRKMTRKEAASWIAVSKLKVIYQEKQALWWRTEIKDKVTNTLGAPLLYQNEIVGFLLLEGSESSFTREHLHLLGMIALLAANGVANLQKYLDHKEHLRRVETLGKVTLKLSALLDKKNVFKEAAREACKLLKCTKSSIVIKSNGDLKIAYAIGLHKKPKAIEVPLDTGLVGWVIRNGKPILSPDLPEDLGLTLRGKYRTQSLLIVPIFDTTDASTIGALCVTDRINNTPFSVPDKEIITFLSDQIGIALANAHLFENATVDHLTKLYLRGYLFEKLQQTLDEALVSEEPLALLLLDLDYFKSVNDSYGHQVGDLILSQLGGIIKSFVREDDIAGRYGGEEFIILLRNTGKENALIIAERIRGAVEEFTFYNKKLPLKLTVSIGVCEYIADDSTEDIILRADRAMYKAKDGGRNQVC